MPLPHRLAVALLLPTSVAASFGQRADSVVTFNEVHYHPVDDAAPEWLELHNQMAVRVDLSGWSLTAGVDFTFPEGAVIEPGAYFVVTSDPGHAQFAGVDSIFGPFGGRLDNGGETLRLRGRHGRVMDELDYSDGGRWPAAPDGGGVTLAKRDPESASGEPSSWEWSDEAGGTPGRPNFALPGSAVEIEAVSLASTWRYTSDPGDGGAWLQPGFDDSAWASGSGRFATSLVANPSFEAETFTSSPGYVSSNGPITGWSTGEGGEPGGESRIGINTPGAVAPFANNGAVPDGGNVAFIRGGIRSLVQEISGLSPSTRYLLRYRENGRSPTTPIGGAALGGVEVVPQHAVSAVDSLDVFAAPYHWQVGTPFVAASTSAELRLRNHAGIGETLLYDAVQLDPVGLYHTGSGATTVDLPFADGADTLTMQASLAPGAGAGARIGFKAVPGGTLAAAGTLWIDLDQSGRCVLRADESGGDHVVALATGAPVVAGQNRLGLVWERKAGKASVVLNGETLFNSVDLDASAGGGDARFDPLLAGVRCEFAAADGELAELAVAAGADADSQLARLPDGAAHRLRTEFELASPPAGAELLLDLAHIGVATVHLNGVEILPATASSAQRWVLPADALRGGTNALAVELGEPASPALAALEAALTVVAEGAAKAAPGLRLSEVAAVTAPDFFIEITNTARVPVPLASYALNSFPLPDEILAPGGFRAFAEADLGFRPADEEIVFLRRAGGAIADAERAENRPHGLDPARDIWQHPSAATPGAPNRFRLDSRVVINEIHYHDRPTYADAAAGVPFAESGLEWVELHNRSDGPVDLTGWSLDGGIHHDFPDGATLPPGGFLVVGGDSFSGALNNRGDRIVLLDASGNTADRVDYLDGYPWPESADGGGSSLELVHPDADNALPGAWAASDESAKPEWQSFRYRGAATEPPGSNNPTGFHEFLMGMLAAGEVLIDDLSVVEDPDGGAVELIQNGGFDADLPGGAPAHWRIYGNHRGSHVVELPGGGRALKLVAGGPLEHSYNIASTTIASGRPLVTGRTYEIAFRAKWLSGSPQLNTRLYFNRLARTHILPQPEVAGTPGAPNSTLATRAPPALADLRHSPLVPDPGEPVRVHVTASAPGGVASATLHYNPGDGWGQVAMASADADGFVGQIPGFGESSIVQFYVEAATSSGATATLPPGGTASRALYRIGDRAPAARRTLRLIMLPEEADFMHVAHHTPSNHRTGCTVIWDDRELWYDCVARLRGSPYGRRGSRVGWNVKFPADRPFRGAHGTVAIDGGYSIPRGDGTGWIAVGAGVATNELIYNQMAHRAGGVPASFDDIAFIEAPRPGEDKLAQLKMARFGDVWKASSFRDGDRGSSFKFELVYHPRATVDGDPESPKSVYNAVRGIDIRDMGADKEAYRHHFLAQNHTDRDDYGPVIAAGMALSSPAAALRDATDAVLDIDNWLRVMAFQSLTMTLDSYNNGLPHNMLLYDNPESGKVMWVPWDVDHAFYAAPNSSIYGLANADFADVVQIPANRRAYCGHLLDLCETGFHPSYIGGWVEHFNAAGEQPTAAHFTAWIADRRAHVLAAIAVEHPPEPFRITTNGGDDFATAESSTTLSGKGWIDVHRIFLGDNTEPLALRWIDNDDWEIVVPVAPGANELTLRAVNRRDETVGTAAITVTGSAAIPPASADHIVVSELMYHPADPSPTEIAAGFLDADQFEYLELSNISAATVELTGLRFVSGIDFVFGSSTVPPGGKVLLVRDQAAFDFRYGAGRRIAGEFAAGTGLSNGGERIALVDAGGAAVRDFTYDDRSPWPAGADGGGYSLTLIAPHSAPDHSLAKNWRHSTLPGGSPGATDGIPFPGDPTADTDGDGLADWINHALGASGDAAALTLSPSHRGTVLQHRRNLAADDARIVVETSTDGVAWSDFIGAPLGSSPAADGTEVVRWLLDSDPRRTLVRLRIEAR